MLNQKLLTAFLGLVMMSLLGCGGGGGGDTAAAPSPAPVVPVPPPVVADNIVPVTIDEGPVEALGKGVQYVNHLYVSVKVCVPGTQNCAVVDHVLLDTGSTGLRLAASALPAGFSLPQRSASNNQAYAQCMQYVGGYSWGPLKTADLYMGGEVANNLAIQIIDDASYSAVPDRCSSDAKKNFLSEGVKGVFGVSPNPLDCGANCTEMTNPMYYVCATPQSCTTTGVPLSGQVPNPITLFASDNNGSAITLPNVPSQGASTVTGSLMFGIGTRSNNGLASAVPLQVNAGKYTFRTLYNNVSYSDSYIDSGTNFYAVPNPNTEIPECTNPLVKNFLCPTTTLNRSATLMGNNGLSANVSFSVDNAENIFRSNPSFSVFNNIAGASGSDTSLGTSSFAWGLPFFLGKTVFTAIEGKTTPSSTPTPYVAF